MRIRAVAGWAIIAVLSMLAGGCSKNGVDPNLPAITTEPTAQTAKVGATATFSVTATGAPPLAYQWFEFAKPIKGATSATYTTPTLAASDNNAFFFVLVTNSIGSIESDEVLLAVTTTTPPPAVSPNTLGNRNPADVLTMHNDAARTGQYLGETILTPENVSVERFGKLGTLPTDGQVDAQPLYASGVTLRSGDVRNILYVATAHGTVYAFDAVTGATIWQTGLAGANEQPADSGVCASTPQERAVSATPVIDRTRGPHGAIYVIANTKDSAGTAIQRLHAIDINTGAELFSGPTLIQGSASAANSGDANTTQNFDGSAYRTLAGLQLVNGKIYAAWGPTCGAAADSGWVMGFDGANLNPVGTLYLTSATGPKAPGFSLAGISADSTGNLLVFGQSSFAVQSSSSTSTLAAAYGGNAFLRLSTENGFGLTDYAKTSVSGPVSLMNAGAGTSGGAIVLPDFTNATGRVWHLALGAGNDGNIYLLNRDSLGGTGLMSMPIMQAVEAADSPTDVAPRIAYFGDTAYYAASGHPVKTFAINDARLSTSPVNQSTNTLNALGAQLSISARGATGGVLWTVENTSTGILHAYDATDISREIYNSTQDAKSRDAFNSTVSAVSPTIAGGRVYIATKTGIVVFGQLK